MNDATGPARPVRLPPRAQRAAVIATRSERSSGFPSARAVPYAVEAAAAPMFTVDCDGFDLRARERVLRVPFEEAALDADQVRQRMLRLAKAAPAADPRP